MIIDANFGTQLGGSITPTDVLLLYSGLQDDVEAEKISNAFKDNPGRLEALRHHIHGKRKNQII
jgi:hypothetical protein